MHVHRESSVAPARRVPLSASSAASAGLLPFAVAYLQYFLRFNSGPREGIQLFSKREIVGDLAIAKHETIRKTSANPVSRVLQADLNMEISNDFVPLGQKFL